MMQIFIFFLSCGNFPVSYTHLDVYKRQNQGCLAEPADEQFQGLIALFQIFRLYLGGIRVLIAGLPVRGVRTLPDP